MQHLALQSPAAKLLQERKQWVLKKLIQQAVSVAIQ